MLRDMMTVNDIYNYAEAIIEMLREEYGTYDADTLDEVQVEERFAQRLEARGYDVRTAVEPVVRAAVEPVATGVSQEPPVVPVTVVRTRRATPNTTGGTTRTRRTTTPSDGTRSATSRDTNRASTDSARTPPAGDATTEASAGAESSPASSDTDRAAPRTRRTTRTRSSSNNGESST
jgi:hypothetical protein